MNTSAENIRTKVVGFIRLSRYQDYLAFVTVLTLLGWFFSGMTLTTEATLKVLIILIANLLAVGFTFMINDIEDADDDALNPDKAKRNPVSAKILSEPLAYAAALAVAILCYLLFYSQNTISFVMGAATLILGILYSWRPVRLKSIPILDLVSHSLMLAGFQFIAAYFVFIPDSGVSIRWVLPLILVVAVSMYGELFNELRDFHFDQKAGLLHTAALLGKNYTKLLMNTLLGIAVVVLITAFVFGLIPELFILITVILGIFLLRKPWQQLQSKTSVHATADFQTPVVLLLITSLLLWGLLHVLSTSLHLGLL